MTNAPVIQPKTYFFAAAPDAPNNPELPVLLYRHVMPVDASGKADRFARHFDNHGWRGLWRAGIFNYRHYHSNAHEALAIAAGWVRLELGGDAGQTFILRAGDLVILPAGTAHNNLGASDDLMVIGAYPAGQENYDVSRGFTATRKIMRRVQRVKRPPTDPYYGVNGPLINHWPSDE